MRCNRRRSAAQRWCIGAPLDDGRNFPSRAPSIRRAYSWCARRVRPCCVSTTRASPLYGKSDSLCWGGMALASASATKAGRLAGCRPGAGEPSLALGRGSEPSERDGAVRGRPGRLHAQDSYHAHPGTAPTAPSLGLGPESSSSSRAMAKVCRLHASRRTIVLSSSWPAKCRCSLFVHTWFLPARLSFSFVPLYRRLIETSASFLSIFLFAIFPEGISRIG